MENSWKENSTKVLLDFGASHWIIIVMENRILTVDIDDVLADFVGGMKRRFGSPKRRISSPLLEVWPDVDYGALLRDEEFHLSLRPIPLSQTAMNKLALGREIHYVSARPPVLLPVTTMWLKIHCYPDGYVYCLGKSGKKEFLAEHRTQVIIDDMPDNLKVSPSPVRLLFEREWSELDVEFTHVYDWLRIEEMLRWTRQSSER